MHYNIGVTYVYNGHVFYTPFKITRQSNPLISKFNRQCNAFTSVWSIITCNTSTVSIELLKHNVYLSSWFILYIVNILCTCAIFVILYTNIDLKLRTKSHGPMHYKVGVTCVYNGHVLHDILIHLFHNSIVCGMNSRVSDQCMYTIPHKENETQCSVCRFVVIIVTVAFTFFKQANI